MLRHSKLFVAALLPAFALIAHAQAIVVPIPAVEGPITGPGDMQPGIRPGPEGTNLGDFDYIDEEYFVSGIAAGAPYKTRIVIRRPKSPEKFTGIVVSEPTHRGDHRSLRMPDGGPVYEGYFVSAILGSGQIAPLADAPIVQMPTQFELHSTNGFRRPDSDARENPAFSGCTHPELSHFPYGAMTFMGLQHLIDWTVEGTIPPRAAPMEIDNDTTGDGTRVTFHIPNSGPGLCNQTGWVTPLPEEVMSKLYKNYGTYVSQVEHRLQELMDDGWFPKEYRTRYVQGDLKLFPK